MAKRLTFVVEVSEPSEAYDEDIESEILEIIRTSFINTVALLDYCANNLTTSAIEDIE